MPCPCVRGARGRGWGLGPVPGFVPSPLTLSRHVFPALRVLGSSSCMVKMCPKLPPRGTAKTSSFGGTQKHKIQKSHKKQLTGPFSFIFKKTDCPGK